MKRKWLITGAIVGLLVLVVLAATLRRGETALAVTVTQVAPRSIHSSVLASGQFEYKEQVELRPQVGGQIVALPVVAGQRVKKGQVVLRIDPKTYQATVNQQRANVALQRFSIRRAELRLANLKLEWQRKAQLFKRGLLDANSYDQLTNQYQLAQVARQSAGESLSAAAAQLQYAEEQLAKTVIRSPISGIVTLLNLKVGESVIPGTVNIPGSSLMQIGDPSELLAKVYVDEADIAHISVGEKAQVTSTAYPNQNLSGRVLFVAPAATTMPGQQGQGFEVKIRIRNAPKLAIRPQMTCRAEIFTRSLEHTLAVPVSAVLFSPGGKKQKSLFSDRNAYVYIDQAGRTVKRKVTLGISSDTWQEIKSGLKTGERVITGPYETLHTLAPDVRVKTRAATGKPAGE